MKKTPTLWIAVVAAAVLASALVLHAFRPKPEDASITIGVILPMTGPLAALGQNEAKLLQATALVLNQGRADSQKVTFKIEDAALDAKRAATIANLFASQKISIVMGSTTPLAAPVLPITEESGQLMIVHSMTEALLDNTRLALRIYPGIQDEVRTIGKWLSAQPGRHLVYALRLDSEWSAKWVADFRLHFPSIGLDDETYTLQDINVRDALAKAADKKPTHLLLLGYGQEYPSILRQVKEARLDVPILGNIGFAYAGTVGASQKATSQDLLQGCLFPFLDLNESSEEYTALAVIYRQEFNADPLQEPTALYFFDTTRMVLKAIDAVGPNPEAIRSHILTQQNPYSGVTGKIRFTPDGNSSVDLTMAKYDSGASIRFLDK